MAKKKRRVKSKKAFRVKLKTATIYSIVQVVLFSIAGLIIVSFARQGLALYKLNDFLVSNFSWTTVFLPFIFLSLGFLVSKFRTPLGSPNVVVGSFLFFLSILTLTRAGFLGRLFWDGAATLITPIGSFIVLLGTSIVGLIILFNTSIDQIFLFLKQFFNLLKGYIVRRRESVEKSTEEGLKVVGRDSRDLRVKKPVKKPVVKSTDEPLAQKLVSNVPGEKKVWKYPSRDILSDTKTGKADRGDVKSNAASIEQTLDSFGITAKVVEVNSEDVAVSLPEGTYDVVIAGNTIHNITGTDGSNANAAGRLPAGSLWSVR